MPTSAQAPAGPPKPKPVKKRIAAHARAMDAVRAVLIARVDALLPEVAAAVGEAADGMTPAEREAVAVRIVQALQVLLFPEAFAGKKGRAVVPHGLLPRMFTQAQEYAADLRAGQKSSASGGRPAPKKEGRAGGEGAGATRRRRRQE